MPKPPKNNSSKNDFPPGVAKPALRALAAEHIASLDQLAQRSESEILNLHGMGPNAMGKLKVAMNEKGLTFKESKKAV